MRNVQVSDIFTDSVSTYPPLQSVTSAGSIHITSTAGPVSIDTFNLALQTITYDSTEQNPSTAPRVVAISCNDGTLNSAVVLTTIQIVPVNDAPVLDLDSTSSSFNSVASFTEGSGAVSIAPSTVSSDIDSTNFANCYATLSATPDGTDESLSVDVSGTSLTAAYSPSTRSLSIFGITDIPTYDSVLQKIKYNNLNNNPNTTARVVTIYCNDDSNSATSQSTPRTATISITSVNNHLDLD